MNFEIKRDLIDVTTMSRYITVHKITGKAIPLVNHGEYWYSECGDMHSDYSFDKRFSPKNFQEKWVGGGVYKEFAPGLTHFYIDGLEVTKEEFESKGNPAPSATN